MPNQWEYGEECAFLVLASPFFVLRQGIHVRQGTQGIQGSQGSQGSQGIRNAHSPFFTSLLLHLFSLYKQKYRNSTKN